LVLDIDVHIEHIAIQPMTGRRVRSQVEEAVGRGEVEEDERRPIEGRRGLVANCVAKNDHQRKRRRRELGSHERRSAVENLLKSLPLLQYVYSSGLANGDRYVTLIVSR
jgi:hypothetical protein